MPLQAEHVHAELVHVRVQLFKGLDRVSVEQDAFIHLIDLPADLRQRHDAAGLVVHVHDGNEDGVRGQRGAQRVHIERAVAVDRKIDYVRTLSCERFAVAQDGRMLHGRRDDASALLSAAVPDAPQHRRVAFRAAGREEHFVRGGVQRGSHLLPGLLEDLLRVHTHSMQRRRISKILRHCLCHDLRDLGPHLGSSAVV